MDDEILIVYWNFELNLFGDVVDMLVLVLASATSIYVAFSGKVLEKIVFIMILNDLVCLFVEVILGK